MLGYYFVGGEYTQKYTKKNGVSISVHLIIKGKGRMKKILKLALVLCLIVSFFALAAPVSGDDPSKISSDGSGTPVEPLVTLQAVDNIIFEQPPLAPSDSWNFYNSSNTTDWDYLCMDDFWGLTSDIYDIHWYGISVFWDGSVGFTEGDPSGMLFEITFYEDDSGAPGTEVAQFSGIGPTYEAYDIFNAVFQAYRFDFDLTSPVSLSEGWVSIRSTYSPSDYIFMWLDSDTGNDNAIQEGYGPRYDNLAFALTGTELGGCSYEICLTDSYGDGWNGGYIDVYVNAVLVYDNLTLSDGWGPECYPISVNTGDEITVYYTEGPWAYECEYYIYDGCGNLVRSEGTGGVEPGNVLPGQLYATCECEPSPSECEYEICLEDSYGDGWNGGYIDVYVNAVLVYDNLTLSDGSGPECHPISVNTGEQITVYFTGVSWPYECEYYIYDGCGNLVRSEGTGEVEPGNVLPGQLYATCECEPPPPPCEYEICLQDSYGDGWNGGYIDVYVNGFLYYTLTLETGWGPECFPISVNTGDEITVYFSGGGWPEECEYHIYDGCGNLVRSEGTGGYIPGNVLPGQLYATCECETSPLEVTKDASTSFTRTYSWTIDKSADQTALTLSPGQEFQVGYYVELDAAFADSDWVVSGNIVINNPGESAALIVMVEDVLPGATSLSLDCGVTLPYELPPGGSLTCTYSAGLPDNSTRTNTATVTLADGTVYTSSAVVDFGSATVNEVDECIDISDTYTGSLGTICYGDGVPKTFFYGHWIGPYEVCGDYTVVNTASFVTNDTGITGADSWTVAVSIPCSGCTLSPGYWKTHSEYGPAPYDDTWAILPDGADTPFFLSGQSYYEVLWNTSQGGNAYYILAKAYIAAELNFLNGADPTAAQAAFNVATVLFQTYTPAQVAALKGKSPVRRGFVYLAEILDNYNNGYIGPGHCSE